MSYQTAFCLVVTKTNKQCDFLDSFIILQELCEKNQLFEKHSCVFFEIYGLLVAK